MWIVASIPLWSMGLLLLAAPINGYRLDYSRGRKWDRDDVTGAGIAFCASAVFLYLAAWVAS